MGLYIFFYGSFILETIWTIFIYLVLIVVYVCTLMRLLSFIPFSVPTKVIWKQLTVCRLFFNLRHFIWYYMSSANHHDCRSYILRPCYKYLNYQLSINSGTLSLLYTVLLRKIRKYIKNLNSAVKLSKEKQTYILGSFNFYPRTNFAFQRTVCLCLYLQLP